MKLTMRHADILGFGLSSRMNDASASQLQVLGSTAPEQGQCNASFPARGPGLSLSYNIGPAGQLSLDISRCRRRVRGEACGRIR